MDKLPTGIRNKDGRLQMRIKRPGRGWDWEATRLSIEEDPIGEKAFKVRAATQAIVDTGDHSEAYGRERVASYAKRWLQARRDRGLKTVNDDETRMARHVLSVRLSTGRTFGELFMDEVRPLYCRAVMRDVIAKGLAPRTVHNVHTLAQSMFGDAVPDEIIPNNPWAIPSKELPKKRDKDPKFRALAKLTKAEIRALLWAPDEKVPPDRRVFYALCYFGAMRFGEAAARRWGDRLEMEPRRALHIHNQYSTERKGEDETKTESVRMMPEHPTLSALLAEWKLSGWRKMFGRQPTATDLIVPSRRGVNRSSNHMLKKFKQDLERLGLRPRRQHDLRRSLIGHAVDDGATRDRLKPGTHGLGTSVLELYDSPEWSACCDAVLKLQFEAPEVIELPIAVGASSQPMGSTWGGDSKMHQNQPSDAFKWRGGRDSNPRYLTQSVAAQSSNSATLRGGQGGRSQVETHDSGGRLPILPMTEAAKLLLEACGGDVEAAIEALRLASRGGRSS
jgi:integrase